MQLKYDSVWYNMPGDPEQRSGTKKNIEITINNDTSVVCVTCDTFNIREQNGINIFIEYLGVEWVVCNYTLGYIWV